MDWYDVEDILFDGSKEEMSKLKCPDCKGNIHVIYSEKVNSMQITCNKCGAIERLYGVDTPNCYLFFGNEKIFPVE